MNPSDFVKRDWGFVDIDASWNHVAPHRKQKFNWEVVSIGISENSLLRSNVTRLMSLNHEVAPINGNQQSNDGLVYFNIDPFIQKHGNIKDTHTSISKLTNYNFPVLHWLNANLNILTLFFVRLTILVWIYSAWFLLCISIITQSFDKECIPPYPWYMYFTFWNFMILSVYFLSLVIYSAIYIMSKLRHDISAKNTQFEGLGGRYYDVLRRFLLVVHQQQLTANIIVTTVFWIYTYPFFSDRVKAQMWSFPVLTQHVFNLCFMLFEALYSCIPVEPLHTALSLSVSAIYLGLCAWLYGALPSMPLDFRDSSTSVILLIVLTIHLASHSLFSKWSICKQAALRNGIRQII